MRKNTAMNKKILSLILIIILLTGYTIYLQFGREIKVVNSLSITFDNYHHEQICVVLNKLIVTENHEKIAEEIVQKTLSNDFSGIKFSFTEHGYPNKLYITVYKSEDDFEAGNKLFAFSYKHDSY